MYYVLFTQGTDGGQSVLRSVLPESEPVRRADSGVTGLVVDVVDTERGESGLGALLGEDENAESGLCVLGDAFAAERALPFIISEYSDGDGFHDVR